ncbi:MAG TPA: glycoside-pentoside-hexuronide (GPH):cation symporter [Clostridia bacterium]|nr:glycoside-pentoside-hexuronide (GPH):cation symporter [Clostridia bacterium]
MKAFLKKIVNWSFPKADRDIGDYSNKERNFFLVGMLGQNIIYAIEGAALNVFYTDVLVISTLAVAIIMGISRVWDAVNDVLMGTIVDKTHTKWGKCRPYLKYIPIPIAITTILMFLPITGAPMWFKIIYVCVSFLLWESLYTLGDIPLWGMTSLMTPDESKRSKLISLARIVSSLGAIVIAAFAPLKDAFGKLDLGWFANTGKANYTGYFSEAQGYFLAICLIAIVGGILFKFPFPNIRERINTNTKENDTGVKENLKFMVKNKPFLLTVASMVLGATKMLVLSAGLYFCKWVLGNGSEGMWVIKLGGAFMGGSLLSMAISPYVAKRFSKRNIIILTSYLSAVPYILIFLLGYQNQLLLLGLLLVSGFLSGFSSVYTTTMVADSVDYMEIKIGKRLDGVFFSGLNFTSKLTAAITLLVSNGLLGIVHYTDVIGVLEAEKMAAITQGVQYNLDFANTFPDVARMMLILITIVPAIGCVLQAIPMHFYDLTDKRHKEILEELKIMREKNRITSSEENV